MTKTILYHGHCADGFGAAWAAWRKLGDDASYVPVLHGPPPPELPRETAVTILDFSYSRVEMLSMRERHKELRVIDHHRTAEVALSGSILRHSTTRRVAPSSRGSTFIRESMFPNCSATSWTAISGSMSSSTAGKFRRR